MISYNPIWLNNLFIRSQAAEAFKYNCLDKDEYDGINSHYPVHFYSPNFFIRIGLFLLTTVIVIFTFGLFALVFLNSIENAIGGLAIFFAMLAYAVLEYMVQSKNHFQSGVDDALLWIAAGSLFGGISYLSNAGHLSNCVLVFIISLYGTLRFADRGMSIILCVSLLGIFFFTLTGPGAAARSIVPFVIMAVSAVLYWGMKKMKRLKINPLYSGCVQIISVTALISFYISGNYYVVRELSNTMFDLNLAENQSIPLGWLFWLFTILTPCVYIARGIQKKDMVLIRVGLLLVAALVFTVRYYYSIVSAEVALTCGGIILIIVSYGLTRYLKIPKYGFTGAESVSADGDEKEQMESILLAQTFTSQPVSADTTSFGGGSFGGGGASGEF